MRRLIVVGLLAGLALFPRLAAAAPSDSLYVVQLARVADDAYRDSLDNLVVITSGCLSLTLGDDVIYDDALRQLTFPDGQVCRVSGIYRPSIQLTRVDQDLYKDSAGRGYLRTQYCYVYAYSEDVILLSDRVLFIESGEWCNVALY